MFPGKFFRGVARAVSVASAAVAWCGVVQTACGGGYDVDGRPLRRQTPFGEVDGMRSTVGDVADFAAGAGVSSNDVVSISRGVAREEVAPVSNLVAAVSSELGGKVDREDGKGLSSNDFTDGDAEKLGLLDVRSGASDRRVAIGYGADAPGDAGTGGDAVAVGCEAMAEAQSSVQLGGGTNAVGQSMQFRGANLFVVQSTASGATASLGGGFPMASRTVAGAVKVGDNVSVTEDGVISVAPAPSEYVRDASRSQDGKTLTLTRNDGTTVSFQGGGGSVDSVNGQTGTVVLTGEDIKTSGDDEETLADKVVTLGTELGSHTADVDNPHSVSARQVGAYTSEEVDDRLELKQDALTDDQKAVLDGGPYIGATGSQRIDSDGAGASLTIEGDSSNGGSIFIKGGGHNGAFLSVEDGVYIPASIKKGGKEVATEEQVESAKTELNARIDLIEATSRPNMNIVGSPTFREGNVSGFSANDYLVFPTAVSVGQNTVEFHMAFHAGSDVNTQQNIMDSWCGLAFAIRNGTTVTAISTNGTSFLAESTGGTIRANNSYRMKMLFSYEDGQYRTRIYLADGAGDFVEVGTGFTADAPVYATATYWGGANPGHATHAFGGIINLNECRMLVNGVEVWRGYDELPTVKFDPTAEDPLDTAEKIVARAGGLISTNNAAFCEAVRDVPPDTSGRWGEWGTIGACLAGLVVAVAALKRTINDIAASVSENSRFLVSGDADGNGTTARIETRESGDDPWPEKPEIRFDKGYEPLSGSEMVKLDKSVQTITMGVGASSLDVVLPDAVDGTVRELVVYVKAADSDCALNFPAGTYYGDNPNGAKAVAGGVTAVYLTEMGEGGWMLRIMELEQHTMGATA